MFHNIRAPEVGRNSQRCRKSEEPEIGTGSKVGNQKSKFFSEIGNRKEKTQEIGNKIFILKTELI